AGRNKEFKLVTLLEKSSCDFFYSYLILEKVEKDEKKKEIKKSIIFIIRDCHHRSTLSKFPEKNKRIEGLEIKKENL
ncbi:12028_t:CDS:2, partial [Entrophospora sp. SA101]